MIAVVGSPVGRSSPSGVVAAGLPVAIARAAVADGGVVQLIGKLGEGGDGDSVLLSLARDGIGHVALLRQPGAVPVQDEEASPAESDDGPIDVAAEADDADGSAEPGSPGGGPPGGGSIPAGPPLDAADLELALRYLPEYAVVVVAQPLDAAALQAVADAAAWAGARLIVTGGTAADGLPDDATILEPPADDAAGAFASVVGRYAAELDRGSTPADAFATASSASGWSQIDD